MNRALAALAALALASACSPSADEAAATSPLAPPPPATEPIDVASFSREQQADLRAVVRDYLVRDPTVLREALETLAAREHAERETQIVNDPRSFSLGPENAPITIVEYFDYQCPYCHVAYEWVFELARTRRDVRIVFKEYPVLSQESAEAARAAIASLRQGKYQPFHRALMAHRGGMPSDVIDRIAGQAGVDVARMRRDMTTDGAAIESILQQNQQHASESGLTGTPAFLINGEWVRGWLGREGMDAKLAEAAERVRVASN